MVEVININLNQRKKSILSNAFIDLGMNLQKEVDQNEIMYFLNKKSKDKHFDLTLSKKLFQYIEIDGDSKITVEDFINSFLQFEEELNAKNKEIQKKLINEQDLYDSYQEECYKYKDEKLNTNGFSENAKLSIEITGVEMKKNLSNIKNIILYLIYNSQKEEIKFDYMNYTINFNNHRIYEFKSLSKKDKFELILKGVKNTEDNEIIDIGEKIFPLEEIISQEEYTVQITISDKGKEDNPVAFINAKIILHWSDYKFYEEKKKNCENKIRKLNDNSLKINKYLLKIKEIYGLSFNNYYTEQTQATKENVFNIDSNIEKTEYFSEKNINQFYYEKDTKLRNIYDNNDPFRIGYEEAKSGYEINISDIKNYNRNSYKNLRAVWLIKLLSLLCILFGLFNSLQRGDYLSAIVGIICFWYIYIVDKKNLAVKSKNFWNLFLLVFFAMIFDFIWLYINMDFLRPIRNNGGDYESAIKILSFFNTGCNSIIKCCLAILIFAQYKLNY